MESEHTSFVAIKRRNPDSHQLEFMVMDSIQKVATRRRHVGHVMIKFPGGDAKSGESPAETANREVWEETGLAFLRGEKVWVHHATDDHVRYGFLVDFEDCAGQVRTWTENDGKETLYPPRWQKASVLKNTVCEGQRDFCRHVCEILGV